ncbi:uncharacterized protein LOC131693485 [Topomyia yanbarensis]|uniref:uncharacterized protein LOC131693485 n=1 Tax=Topomyia yanbarensis TaxID=2498891 RepID=UPI00273B25C4|nr:uncharacterized protein LOC131693485 [Topomyia yanbarensis]
MLKQMSKFITEDDVPVGYSSEQDDDYDEYEKDVPEIEDPAEIYIGNTGKVSASKFFNLFKMYGFITNMFIWRTHNHLYHARITYKRGPAAQKAVTEQNGKFYNGKRLRVTLVKDKVPLSYPAAIRIDDLCAGCTEEDIYEHFAPCGEIRFVVKIGFSAYIQFNSTQSATNALSLEMILNGDPYTITRIFSDDRVDHEKSIENMKQIKHRKPFVMVENFPRYEQEVPLNRYKSCFETVGLVQHFKIAPTSNGTVTLALAMAKADERDMVIGKFNNTIQDNKVLKLYMVPGRAVMTIHHAATFASAKSSVVVSGIPPYYKDYDVCMLFKKCGEINFLECFDGIWLIAFENQSAVSLAHFFHFSINKQRLVIRNLTPDTLPGKTLVKLHDYEEPKDKKEPVAKVPPRPNRADDFLLKAMQSMDQQIKRNNSILQQQASATADTSVATKPKITERPNNIVIKTVPIETLKRPAEPVTKINTSIGRAKADASNTSAAEASDDDDNTAERKNFSTNSNIYIGNLAKGLDEKDICELFKNKKLQNVTVYCSKDSYHPTAVSYVEFVNRSDIASVIQHNHDRYRGKRVMIVRGRRTNPFFAKDKSFMVKNLTSGITEEGLLNEIEKVLGPDTVGDVIRPAYHYAYVSLEQHVVTSNAIDQLREAFTRFKIDVYQLYTSIPKQMIYFSINPQTAESMRKLEGLKNPSEMENSDKNFGVHNAHKVFVGNIPRDTSAEDVIDYFSNYGNVIDYSPIEKKSCYLRKSAIISFLNSKHAQNVHCRSNHYFEGSKLKIHSMEYPPYQYRPETQIVTVKSHSPFLTCDEVQHALSPHLRGMRIMRFDAYDDRANFIVKHIGGKGSTLEKVFAYQYINDEAILVIDGLDLTPPKVDEARESKQISNSLNRQQKEKYLSYVVYKENVKEDMEIRTKPSSEQDIPFKMFYNDNAIQINNVSLDTTLENIRDLFLKCGNISDYQALILEEDNSKICYVKFETDLAADLACTYNQRLLNGSRILIHLAKETVHVEKDRTIFVEQLNPQTTAEQIYYAFSRFGMIKFVHKQSPFTAIVCFKDRDSMEDAINAQQKGSSVRFVISQCYKDYDSRFFNNFTTQEEFISIEEIRTTLKPRVRPEYHQSNLERQVFEVLPEKVKSVLINEIFLARNTIPNFSNLTKPEQIVALKTEYEKFTQKEYFVGLNVKEQEKLLDITKNLQKEYPYEEVKNMDILEPIAKQPRNDQPKNNQPDKKFAANWYSEPSQADKIIQNPPTAPLNAHHVAQALPSTGLLSYGGPLSPANPIPPVLGSTINTRNTAVLPLILRIQQASSRVLNFKCGRPTSTFVPEFLSLSASDDIDDGAQH